MKRVAIYLRVSTQEQAINGFGLDSQERVLKAYVESNKDEGWVVGKNSIYVDKGISGSSNVEYRPALTQLKTDIIDGKVDIVLVWRIDRLFRKARFLLEFIEFLKEYNVNFVSKNESIDLDSHTGRLVLTLMGGIAEMEKESNLEKMNEGKISKALQGFAVYGKTPFGYERYKDGKGKRMRINEEEADFVRNVFDLFVNQNMTASAIRTYLTSLNIGTREDKEGIGKNKISKNYIHYSFIREMLSNETYIGTYYFRKTKTTFENGKRKERPRPKNEWLSVECDRIIDDETFNKAQEKLKKGKVMNGRGQTHLFTGLLKCGTCGRSFVHYKSKKDTSNYRCIGKNKARVGSDILCKNRDISEIKLLNIIWEQLDKIFKNPKEFIDSYIRLEKDQTETINKLKKELLTIDDEILNKEKAIKNGLRRQLEDEDNFDYYSEIISDLTNEKQTLYERKVIIEEKLSSLMSLNQVKEIIERLSKIYNENYGNIDNKDKESFIKEVITKIEIGETDFRIFGILGE